MLYPSLGEDLDNPAAFPRNKELSPGQADGARFLVKMTGCLLADEMGLGKTIQVIVALRYRFQKAQIRASLIICPRSIVNVWQDHLKEWAPELRVIVVEGRKEERKRLWKKSAHIHMAGYETVSKDEGMQPQFDLVILDEIQRIKNPRTELYESISRIPAEIRWGLSGTPIENSLRDLVTIINYLVPGLVDKKEREERVIMQKVAPYILRREKKAELPGLPQKRRTVVWLDLSESQRRSYEEVRQNGVDRLKLLGDGVTVDHAIALITELMLICSLHPDNPECSSKLVFLKKRLAEIDRGDKVLVFSQFPVKTLRRMQPLINMKSMLYDGSTSLKKRDEILKLFQKGEDYRLLLISTRCGGIGLNLQRANHVFLYDSWWNPQVLKQAEDRVHRMGQRKTVFVTHLYVRDTVEEKVYKVLRRKRKLFDATIGGLKARSFKSVMTRKEIFSLLNIRVKRKNKS